MARTLLTSCDEHPHLVLCGIKSESSLWTLLSRLERLGIAFRPFRDSDLGDQLTAVATEPVHGDLRRHFRRYQCLTDEEVGP